MSHLAVSDRLFIFFFFFKQKTAYEMRISDWSSDVCSSDLCPERGRRRDELPAIGGAGDRYRAGKGRNPFGLAAPAAERGAMPLRCGRCAPPACAPRRPEPAAGRVATD